MPLKISYRAARHQHAESSSPSAAERWSKNPAPNNSGCSPRHGMLAMKWRPVRFTATVPQQVPLFGHPDGLLMPLLAAV